ncbi:hypothetical protein HGRIS_007339 [Hohenbuehelia grisea]|uniref:Uncharacterized protein n=1 Tax=Hohenbuehelia grisea TaxID=104357 RepID=A0ABR3J555_9AGAR
MCRACNVDDPIEQLLADWMNRYHTEVTTLARCALGYDQLSHLPPAIADAQWNNILRDYCLFVNVSLLPQLPGHEPYKQLRYEDSGLVKLEDLPSMNRENNILRNNVRSHITRGEGISHLETFVILSDPYSNCRWPKANRGLRGRQLVAYIEQEQHLKRVLEAEEREPGSSSDGQAADGSNQSSDI